MVDCAWCGSEIEWTETFAQVAPARWVHVNGDERCRSRWGFRWASPERRPGDESMADYWVEKSREEQEVREKIWDLVSDDLSWRW